MFSIGCEFIDGNGSIGGLEIDQEGKKLYSTVFSNTVLKGIDMHIINIVDNHISKENFNSLKHFEVSRIFSVDIVCFYYLSAGGSCTVGKV